MNKSIIGGVLVLWLSLQSMAEGAAPQQSLEAIEQAVVDHVQKQHSESATVSVQSLDSRLRLPMCDSSLSTNWSSGSATTGRVTVQVGCETGPSWRIHVQATVTREQSIWVVSRPMRRNEVLTREKLEQLAMVIGDTATRRRATQEPVEDLSPYLGQEFTRAVAAGEPLDASMLTPRKLVLKNESVLLQSIRPGLTLHARGISMDSGALDERIPVRNVGSGKIVDAIITGRGVVSVLR